MILHGLLAFIIIIFLFIQGNGKGAFGFIRVTLIGPILYLHLNFDMGGVLVVNVVSRLPTNYKGKLFRNDSN